MRTLIADLRKIAYEINNYNIRTAAVKNAGIDFKINVLANLFRISGLSKTAVDVQVEDDEDTGKKRREGEIGLSKEDFDRGVLAEAAKYSNICPNIEEDTKKLLESGRLRGKNLDKVLDLLCKNNKLMDSLKNKLYRNVVKICKKWDNKRDADDNMSEAFILIKNNLAGYDKDRLDDDGNVKSADICTFLTKVVESKISTQLERAEERRNSGNSSIDQAVDSDESGKITIKDTLEAPGSASSTTEKGEELSPEDLDELFKKFKKAVVDMLHVMGRKVPANMFTTYMDIIMEPQKKYQDLTGKIFDLEKEIADLGNHRKHLEREMLQIPKNSNKREKFNRKLKKLIYKQEELGVKYGNLKKDRDAINSEVPAKLKDFTSILEKRGISVSDQRVGQNHADIKKAITQVLSENSEFEPIRQKLTVLLKTDIAIPRGTGLETEEERKAEGLRRQREQEEREKAKLREEEQVKAPKRPSEKEEKEVREKERKKILEKADERDVERVEKAEKSKQKHETEWWSSDKPDEYFSRLKHKKDRGMSVESSKKFFRVYAI